MAPRSLAPLLLVVAVAVAAGARNEVEDSFALLQLPASGVGDLQAGDEVDVEALEGVPGSTLRGVVTGSGAQPGTYDLAVWEAPPEHRFLRDVAVDSIRLRKAHSPYAATSANQQAAASDGADLFAALDGDRDGAISRTELAKAVEKLVGAAAATPAIAAAVPAAPVAPEAAAALAAGPAASAAAARTPEAAASEAVPAVAPEAPAAEQEVLPSGAECWVDGYTRKACCDLYWGPTGDDHCWDGHFTFKRCCKLDDQVMQEAQRYADDSPPEPARPAAATEEEQRRQAEAEAEQRRSSSEPAETQQERMKRAEAEARERVEVELRRRAQEEAQRARREQAAKFAEEQSKLKAEPEEDGDTEGDAPAGQACPRGFQLVEDMDVPGADQFGHDNTFKRKTVESCAIECKKTPNCRSFEWSPTKTQCNLNKVAVGKGPKYQDFLFCKRTMKQASS